MNNLILSLNKESLSTALSHNIFIYRIFHKVSNKSYIGKTTRGTARLRAHLSCYRGKSYDYSAIYNAMRKHGLDAFSVEILENTSLELLNEREKYWIKIFKTRECGYNIRDGGDGGNTWEGLTPDQRAERIRKQSEAQKSTYTQERKDIMAKILKDIRKDPDKSKLNREMHSARFKILNADPEWRQKILNTQNEKALIRIKNGDALIKSKTAYLTYNNVSKTWHTQFKVLAIGIMPRRTFRDLEEALAFRNEWLEAHGIKVPQLDNSANQHLGLEPTPSGQL